MEEKKDKIEIIIDKIKVCFWEHEDFDDIRVREILEQELSKAREEGRKELLTQPQKEENELEKVYVDPIVPNFTGELSAPVEHKTREEIADNLQAQFEYGRHGTYKDLESARKVFDKERVKEWDRTAMETYKQATQDTPEELTDKKKGIDNGVDREDTPEQKEEWEEDFRGFLDFVIEDDGNKKEVVEYVKNLLSEREREVLDKLSKKK